MAAMPPNHNAVSSEPSRSAYVATTVVECRSGNSLADDGIAYFCASRLPGELTGGVEDLHFRPIEPRAVRAYLTWTF
jgi:hypothetical protein